ncbi:hypothetical protein GDO86_011817 [Hymenochirus boettgeri]|uniref:RNA-binding protein 48 n=1 Tax=Hymenochirus boettgeri TaxID=247094 RepID=A0A8T2JKK6_9PIPI|nr:hypothetical protein GDO86_011817 [Hymenochirus boettgeri]
MNELVKLFALYGTIEEYNPLDEYPAEEFTEVYLIKFQRLQSARVAKRKLDESSFFGGLLHVCYAPEFETVQETREKLQERRKFVARTVYNREKYTEGKQETAKISTQSSGPLNESALKISHTSSCDFYAPHSAPLQLCHPSSTISQEKVDIPLSVAEKTCKERLPKPIHQMTPSSMSAGHKRQNPTTSDSSTARFMPRNTQLQERERKRQQSNALALCGSVPATQYIVIGPKLPEIPKLDMDDDSLNLTADVIRGKLKEVTHTPLAGPSEQALATPPVKQRRRI